MRRIGILGGSFDPIHNGHLILAEYAEAELKLDWIIFVPCYKSAYKDKIIQASPNDRIAMLGATLPDKYSISGIELIREGVSYTIDTVKQFVKTFEEDELVLIVGADTIDTFDSWKDSEEIKRLVNIKFSSKDFYVPEIGISSTLIRKLVKEGKSIKYLVPEAVEDYIIKNKLYKRRKR